MKQRRIYCRLIEKDVRQLTDEESLIDVRRSVETLGTIEWESLPKVHPRGGFTMSFFVPDQPDFEAWSEQLERQGYLFVI